MRIRRPNPRTASAIGTAALLLLSSGVAQVRGIKAADTSQAQSRETGVAAFKAIIPVLDHPRCMNCHSAGDYPRQGDDRHQHTRDVRRGPHGDAVNAVQCSTSHQDHNVAGLPSPPGAPGWELPPPSMPMIWEGLSNRQLCQLLKDPEQNGHRNVQQILDHMSTPLVSGVGIPVRAVRQSQCRRQSSQRT
jgi:hypothetical protein